MLATALVVAGCQGDLTAILLHVCLGPSASEELAMLRLVVEDDTRAAQGHVFSLPADASEVEYSLRPGAELTERVEFTLYVVGLDELGAERINRALLTSFEPDVDRDVAVWLEDDCLDITCGAGETCLGGACDLVPTANQETCQDGAAGY